MDIYSFIDSKDIAAHCREIGKEWTPYEMAVIIGRCRLRPLYEKHTAWRELMDNYTDMPMPKNECHESFPSLRAKIVEVIDHEQRLMEAFDALNDGAAYEYEAGTGPIEHFDNGKFPSIEAVWNSVDKIWESEKPSYVCAYKFIPNHLGIRTTFDYDGNIYEIGDYDEDAGDDADNKNNDIIDFSSFYSIEIPVPFKCGDILTYCEPNEVLAYRNENGGRVPVVFDSQRSGEPDFMASGYIVDGRGIAKDYLLRHKDGVYEYFRGKLSGKWRLLQYLSWYLKGEISLSQMLLMQCKVMMNEVYRTLALPGHNKTYPDEHIIAEGEADHEKLSWQNRKPT